MKSEVNHKRTLMAVFVGLIICFAALNTAPGLSFAKEMKVQKPPKYQLLFFRNDDRVWIVLPPKTTLVEIYPSTTTRRRGWVKAYNRRGEVLALDRKFHGDVSISGAVKKPSIRKGKLVTTRHDENSIAIYTPEDASYIEIINSTNGFDGSVRVLDWKKRLLVKQTGLDIKVINYK